MGKFLKTIQDFASNPVSRTMGQNLIRVSPFQFNQFPIEPVIFGIRDTWFVQVVVFISIAIEQVNQFIHSCIHNFIIS